MLIQKELTKNNISELIKAQKCPVSVPITWGCGEDKKNNIMEPVSYRSNYSKSLYSCVEYFCIQNKYKFCLLHK